MKGYLPPFLFFTFQLILFILQDFNKVNAVKTFEVIHEPEQENSGSNDRLIRSLKNTDKDDDDPNFNPAGARGNAKSELAVIAANYTFPEEVCKLLAETCGKLPMYKDQCLMSCFFSGTIIEPFLRLVSISAQTTCQSANTLFPEIPEILQQHKNKIDSIRKVLSTFGIKKGDESGFANAGANAILLTMIKDCPGEDFDDLKPVVSKLELHDPDDKTKKSGESARSLRIGGRSATTTGGSGAQVNTNCEAETLNDESNALAEALVKRPCLMDLFMPGYFVFSRAPSVATSRKIQPMLRAFNLPLVFYTGVACCMSRYALDEKPYECLHKQVYFEKKHTTGATGPPESKVCGAIPAHEWSSGNKTRAYRRPCQSKGGAVVPPSNYEYDMLEGETSASEENFWGELCDPTPAPPGTMEYEDLEGGKENGTVSGRSDSFRDDYDYSQVADEEN